MYAAGAPGGRFGLRLLDAPVNRRDDPRARTYIETLTPARTRTGRPEVVAQVRNTGKRALDMNGTLTLSSGPGSLRAGPFRATPGTTLGLGQSGPVPIVLDQLIPAGPWQAHVTLNSGRVKHMATAVIRFPASGIGRAAKPVASTLTRALLVAVGALATLALGALFLRRRLRPASPI